MLKVAVFDGGYGGELFADRLKEILPVIEVVRVIDWRNADKLLCNAKTARKVAKEALLPYIGEVDLIVLANHLLTVTSLKYFRRKYQKQKFVGFDLQMPSASVEADALILTTKAMARTINYHNYLLRLKRKTKTISLDHWLAKIDDGELGYEEIKNTLRQFLVKKEFRPTELILACSQFSDIKNELRRALGWNIKTYDSFDSTIRKICKILQLRGGLGKK